MDCSPSGSSVHGILQARILEWVAMPSSRGSSNPGIKCRSPTLQADSLPFELPRKLLANEKEEVESIQIWKEENKIVFAEDMIVCVESIYSYNIT